nr:hypothetical protein [Actinomyces oris]
MKPQPPRRRSTISVPKAAGPDPAALTASSAPIAGNTSNNANASKNGKVGSATDTQKITIRIPTELAGRARSVWRLKNAQPGSPYVPYQELIASWIEAGVEEAEQHLNHGQPLAPTPVGQIPRGRPPRA